MAIIIKTSNPTGLLQGIRTAIDKGTVVTWSYDSEGDFYHNKEQWRGKAWLRPKVLADELRLDAVRPTDAPTLNRAIYGVYHGRFIEMVLTHFSSSFSAVQATP